MSPDPDPRLTPFHHLQTPYKTFRDNTTTTTTTTQQIQTSILIPKAIPSPPKPLPLIIYFHGGGLICGSALYLDWFPHYLLELTQRTPAVLLAPNYRLLPEATIREIFDDILDFWTWVVHGSPAGPLATIPSLDDASQNLAIDRARVLVAGGYLSLCLALRFPRRIRGVVVVVVGYPAFLGVSSSSSVAASAFAVGGGGGGDGGSHGANGSASGLTATAVEEMHHLLNTTLRLAAQHRSPVRSFTDLPDRLDLMDAAMRTGRIAEMFARGVVVDVDPACDPERSLRYPMERLDLPVGIPRGGIVILHGREDEVVPVEDSVRCVRKAREVLRAEEAGKVAVTVREGGHGFDTAVGLGEGWLWESLRGVVRGWLE